MAVSPEYKEFIKEIFEPFGPVTVKRMFGGAGIFVPLPEADLMIGLIADETVYLKVDDSNRKDFEDEGKGPFTYGPPEREREMAYYELPEWLYEDADALAGWARKALDVVLRANAKKPKKRKKKRA